MTIQTQFSKKLLQFIKQNLTKDQQIINPTTRLFEDGVIDSLKILDLIAYIESELGIEIADQDVVMEHFLSIETIDQFFNSKSKS